MYIYMAWYIHKFDTGYNVRYYMDLTMDKEKEM